MRLRKLYILLLGLWVISTINVAQNPVMRFETLSTDDGLSQGVVTSITEDDHGFIWVGTKNGLNRIVGKNISVFHKDFEDPNSLPSDQIQALKKGPDGRIWIGTMDAGIASLDPGTARFTRYEVRNVAGQVVQVPKINRIVISDHQLLYAAAGSDGLLQLDLNTNKAIIYPVRSDSLGILQVVDVMIDHDEIWLASQRRGLVRFSTASGIIKHLYQADPDPEHNYNEVSRIVSGAYPSVYVGTRQNSLFRVNLTSGECVNYNHPADGHYHHANIHDMLLEGQDSLLLATSVGGLQMFHIPTQQVKMLSRMGMPFGIAYNTVNCIFRSSNGILWTGTNGKGISYNHPGLTKFEIFSKKKPGEHKLDFESARSIYGDDDCIFIGGYYGLNRVDRHTGEVKYVMENVVPYCICEAEGDSDLLLIGSEGAGLFFMSKDLSFFDGTGSEGFGFYKGNEFNSFVLIYSVVHLNGNQYLVGHTGGLAIYDLKEKRITKNYTHSDEAFSIVEGEIKSILIDSKEIVWIGSATGGVCQFDAQKEQFYRLDSSNGFNPLPSKMILDLFEDSKNRLWAGTTDGLCRFSRDSGLIRTYTTKDGLSNNSIATIEECIHGHLWLGSNEGLSELDPETGKINNYNDLNGLPGKEMNRGASFTLPDGSLMFGGVDGVVRFVDNPQNSDFPAPNPQVIGYYEFNKLKITDTLLPYTNRIVVPPKVTYFSIEVTGADAFFDEQNLFQYRVPGVTDDWVVMNETRRFTFTNVKPGKYEVGLKVSNDGAHWVTKDPALFLDVKPMFHQTWVFKILTLLMAIAIIASGIYLRTNYLIRQRRVLNELVEQRTLELKESERSLQIANETKDRFFSILAHDLKSPFSALLGLSEFLAGDWDEYSEEERHKMARSIHVTINSTYRLLMNLLEWSRLQMGVIHPENTNINLKRQVKEVLEAHEVIMQAKGIEVEIDVPETYLVWGDVKMTETILRNFLSNAVKFSESDGKIQIRAKKDKKNIVISVHDSGTGIDPKTQESLFNMSTTVSKVGTGGEKGTGLGLMLCKEFVVKMGGDIGFNTKQGEGSEFWFTLPSAI